MPDSRITRLFLQSMGWLSSAEAHWDEAQQMAALELNGHPRAQDFEPTGKGGSDPTSVNGTKPDTAATDGREMRRCLERIWTESERLIYLIDRHRRAVRPTKPEDGGIDRSDWCVLHLEYLDDYAPRYRLDLCQPCYKRKCQTGEYPTREDLEQHAKNTRWPKQLIDPKNPPAPRLASLDRLQLGTQAVSAEEAAQRIEGTA